MLNSVSSNLMAAGITVSHKLLNFQDGGTAMKHLHVNKKALLQKCAGQCRGCWWLVRQIQKITENFHLFAVSSDYPHQVHTVTIQLHLHEPITLLKISVSCSLLNKELGSLRGFFGTLFFGIGLKYINKGHFIYYLFINTTARGFPSTWHISEVTKMWKHILNLSHIPSSHQTLLLFMPAYSWCLSTARNNVGQCSSHCNWSTAPLNLAPLAFAEMAVGSETLSNVSSQDVVNKSFRASFQNLFLCFLPSPHKAGIIQFTKNMAFLLQAFIRGRNLIISAIFLGGDIWFQLPPGLSPCPFDESQAICTVMGFLSLKSFVN